MIEKVRDFLFEFFELLNHHDASIMNLWHESGQLQINQVNKPVSFILNMPPFIGYKLKEIISIQELEEAYVCLVKWEMIMPSELGFHESVLTIKKDPEEYKILSMIDFGH